MAKVKVFIDGREGTTGLRIDERLQGRTDVEQIMIDPALRKDADARAACINASDITFLCLPDAAAVEAVEMVTNPDVKIIDASTAHRTLPDWTYGLAELTGAKEKIKQSKRVAVPGCYAGGFVTLIRPLIEGGLLDKKALVSCFAVSGFSGAGKKAIAQYAAEPDKLCSPRSYALAQTHKHLKEMHLITGLDTPPVFNPMVSSYYAGMVVNVPFHRSQLGGGKAEITACYQTYYADSPFIAVTDERGSEDGFITSDVFAGRDDLEILVTGNEDRIVVSARFDNLGKGASGAAIQCFNLMTDCEETTGLNVRIKK